MRIGVVSDTHNHLPNVRKIVELFEGAGVDRVVHTGDITQAKVLEVFATLSCPVIGVYGNNDLEREALDAAAERHDIPLIEPPLRLEWAGRRIHVVHDPRDLDGVTIAEADVQLHGHTHLRRIERTARSLVFNPGECAGHMKGLNAVGVIDLVSLEPEILLF